MSFHAICAECERTAAYFSGNHNQFNTNESDNLFALSKVEGDRGVTYDDTKLNYSVYICLDCIQKHLPNAFQSLKENTQREKELENKYESIERVRQAEEVQILIKAFESDE